MDYAKRKLEELAIQKSTIQNSGLKQVNEALYSVLMEKINVLNLKLITYQENSGICKEELINASAEIGALFDFYMDTEGSVKVASLHVNEVRENLKQIVNKLNRTNYEEIEKELNEALALYDNILNTAVRAISINEIISRFRYQVLKYKLEDFVIDDTLDVNSIMSFILEDINTILSDDELSVYIKNELKKYAFDVSLISDNFKLVMVLIHFGLNKKDATKEDLEAILGETFYKESDLQKIYHEPSEEAKRKCLSYKNCSQLIDCIHYDDKKTEIVVAIILRDIANNEAISPERIALCFIEYNLDIKYLAEALLLHGYSNFFHYFKNEFYKKNKLTSYIFDTVIVAYKDEIRPDNLAKYIIETSNEHLIRYICKKKNSKYFTKNLKEFAIETNNRTLIEYFIDNNIISFNDFSYLEKEDQIRFLNRRLNDSDFSEDGKRKLLISSIERATSQLYLFIFGKILEYKDTDLLIKAFNKVLDASTPYNAKNASIIVDFIDSLNSPLKEAITEYYYEASKILGDAPSRLINIRYFKDKTDRHFNGIRDDSKINIFDIYFISDFIDKDQVLAFVRRFYQARINWQHTLEEAEKLPLEEFNEVRKYCYLGNHDYFINNVKCSFEKDFIMMMINEVPNSIIDFIVMLSDNEIANLSEEALNAFSSYYEEKMQKEGLSISDKLLIYNDLDFNSKKELLTYIMHKGLLDLDIMFTIRDSFFYDLVGYRKGRFFNIIVKAIKNTKKSYLRPSLIIPLLEEVVPPNFDWTILFMDSYELASLNKDDEASMLKKRKYYGDLLKLLKYAPDNIKERIIMILAKSDIEEYLLYIKSNYPDYMPIVLNNTSNPDVYKKLIEFDGQYNIDDALRISLMEDKPRK